MLKSNWKKKLIAMLLIFVLTFADFAFVGKTFAASIFDSLSGNGDTGSENVEFDANFVVSDEGNSEETKDVKADVNSNNLSIKLNVKVSNDGYLKNGKIILGNGEELNFNIDKDNFENENVQSFEDETVELVQMNADSEVEINLPINYVQKTYLEESQVSKSNVIKFEGIYVLDDDEKDVSKEVDLNLTWQNQREIKVNSEVTKYINYTVDGSQGLILQTDVKVDNSSDLKTLPVKNSELEIEVPSINGVKPTNVKVVANTLMGTEGKEADELEFNEDNYNYDSENNKLNIKVENKTKKVSSQNEDEVLKDETAKEVEAYYAAGGLDEYIITYTFDNVELQNININSKINAKYNMFGETESLGQEEKTYELGEQIGDIVTLTTSSDTEKVSKAYTYLNYNNENKNEVELDNKIIFNISYKDIVEGLLYEDAGNSYITSNSESKSQDDIYYKNLKLNQNNFKTILGEEGTVNIYNGDQLLATINKDSEVSEDGNYVVNFDKTVKKIRIETSKPVQEGNLIFTTVRAYQDVSYGKNEFKDFDRIDLNSTGKAKYKYVENYVDCGNGLTEIKLDNTNSNAEISVEQDSLSTLAVNNDVEIRVKLNNDKETSDVYGNSEFTVKLPEYIDDIDVTDYSIVYGEGLKITDINGYNENGNVYLKIDVGGTQENLSSGIITDGTNIIIKANIKVDLYAPASTGKFELTYNNSEATAYKNEKDGLGYSETEVKYSAPEGVVSVNSIVGYNKNGDTVASVKQGTVMGDLDIYSDPKTAKMELTIMNNEENAISNIAILGRTIYTGNKDVETGNDLGTTTNAPMINGITGVDGFSIYYSTNENATKDLSNEQNGWTQNVESFSDVKSYLIVPNDSNYTLESGAKLRFTYSFIVPGNLAHNEYLYGTYGTYYTSNSELATINEVSVADLVGLTTGKGPELEINSSSNKTDVNEYEEFELTTTIKNTGEGKATNVNVTVPLPENTAYVSSEVENTITAVEENRNIIYNISEIDPNSEKTIKTVIKVQEILDENSELTVYSMASADGLGAILKSDEIKINIIESDLMVTVVDYSKVSGGTFKEGNDIRFTINISNLSTNDLTNISASANIDNPLEVTSLETYDENGRNEVNGNYDRNQGTYNWTVDSIKANEVKTYEIVMNVGTYSGSELSKDINFVVKAKLNDKEYESSPIKFSVGVPSLTIKQTSKNTNTYVKEGDVIEYVFSVTNEGTVIADSVKLVDHVPEGIIVDQIKYQVGGQEIVQSVSSSSDVTANVAVGAGETKDVTVVAHAENLDGVQELSVTNVGSIENGGQNLQSNSITHIIESSGERGTTTGESSTGVPSSSTSNSENLSKSYSITGVAWLDKNKNGAREDDEELIKDVKATLIDSDNGTIKQNAVTNSKGEYKFNGVEKGNYIIIFDYDTVLYTVTTYQKENVASNINSDVITTKIEEDGKQRNGAVSGTVTISDVSISNIDIGLVDAMKFDLSLDMGITKVTVQNRKGTNTKTYDSLKYAKTEISQKYIDGSEVYVEYTFNVKNEGEVAGYATEIVDYLPEGMSFNSGLNSDWFTGSDGNLYTTQLQDTELQPGETKSFKLLLSKTMTEENTGTVSNTAEISKDYNIYAISDMNSTPGNKNQNENDFARADIILGVGTGGIYIYISAIITSVIVIGAIVTIVKTKKNEAKKARERGV